MKAKVASELKRLPNTAKTLSSYSPATSSSGSTPSPSTWPLAIAYSATLKLLERSPQKLSTRNAPLRGPSVRLMKNIKASVKLIMRGPSRKKLRTSQRKKTRIPTKPSEKRRIKWLTTSYTKARKEIINGYIEEAVKPLYCFS